MIEIMSVYQQAQKLITNNPEKAQEIFREIANSISEQSISELSDSKLKAIAFSNMQLFLFSRFDDTDAAKTAISLLEFLISREICDIEVYENYIILLELTYQYEKSYHVLKRMLSDEKKILLALQCLSSPAYAIGGFQTNNDCITYKKKLIDLTDNEMEKKKLIKELAALSSITRDS